MKTINLEEEVMVSDPCYSIPTWCQIKLTGVLPGKYKTICRITTETNGWGDRCSILMAVHENYLLENLSWRNHPGEVGVDSGQAGIFSFESYRNDEVAEGITTPEIDFVLPYNDKEGDKWYEKICKFTLSNERWGLYDKGVVSCSGIGDGGYRCLVTKKNGKIVGIAIDYLMERFPNKFLNEII